MAERKKIGNINGGSPVFFGIVVAAISAIIAFFLGRLFEKKSQSRKKQISEKISGEKENRLKNVGNIMEREDYIQRKEIEQKLVKQTIKNGRSVNVVGMRKIGKSSLIYNVFESKTEEYYQNNNIIVVKILAGISDSADIFFKNMAKKICEIIKRENSSWGYSSNLFRLNEKIQSENIEHDGEDTLCKFFDTIKSYKKRVLCIVDDFYKSSKLFKNREHFFTVLKELVTNPKYDATFVIVSETSVEDLDFIGDNKLYLRGFSDKELVNYYRCNATLGIELNDEERALLKCFTGGHPYWSDIILAEYKAEKDDGKPADMETIFREKAKIIYPEFEAILNLLGEELKNKLYQIVFGPMDEKCTQIDIDTLYDYGILDDRKNPKIISGKLYEYMKMKERDVNFFPLWHDTETGMRAILKSRLKKVYSEEDWEKRICDKYILQVPENILKEMQEHFFPKGRPKNDEDYIYQGVRYSIKQYLLSYDLKEVKKNKENMKRLQDLGIMKWDAEISILEATYTKSLFFLYEFEYEELKLKEIFGDPDKFIEMADHLRNARNTYQHNNDFLLTEEYKEKTLDCCKYLLECIKKTRI